MLSVTRARVLYAALFLGTLLLFCRSFGNGFLDYDDPDYVTGNEHVQAGVTWSGVRWALTSGDAANWHPLTWVSHMLDWQLYGNHPAGHHATSVLFHALNAALAFAVLCRLTGAAWPSAWCAALFAWHPLRVESVAWVAERKDVLSVFFGLLALLAYAAYAERRRRGEPAKAAYAGTLAALAAGLMCKPMLVTLPFLLLLLDVWPLRRVPFFDGSRGSEKPGRSLLGLLAEKAPLFLLVAASCAITYHVQKAGSAVVDSLSIKARLANAAVSIARYIGVFFWPSGLSIAYPLPARWPVAAVAGGVFVGAGCSALAVLQIRRRPWIFTGWFWFLGTLVPVLGIVQVGMQAMADRYTYLPSLGLEIAVVWTVAEWVTTAGRRRVAALASGLILGVCAALTWRQQAFWKGPLTLYAHALAVAPDNYLTQGYLGSYLLNAKNPVAAEAHFRRSLALKPDYGLAWYRLGLALERQGRSQEAEATYTAFLRTRPRNAMANYGLGLLLMRRGDLAAAAIHLKAALRDNAPPSIWIDLGTVQEQRGLPAEAESAFREAVARDPTNGNANFGLALALEDLGRTDEALGYYLKAAECDPHSAETRFNTGTLLFKLGRCRDSLPHFTAAVALKPGFAEAWVGRGLAEQQLGYAKQALADLEHAFNLDPKYPGLAEEIAKAKGKRGN